MRCYKSSCVLLMLACLYIFTNALTLRLFYRNTYIACAFYVWCIHAYTHTHVLLGTTVTLLPVLCTQGKAKGNWEASGG